MTPEFDFSQRRESTKVATILEEHNEEELKIKAIKLFSSTAKTIASILYYNLTYLPSSVQQSHRTRILERE